MRLTGEKVKVNACAYREGIWCSDGIAPLLLNLDRSGQLHVPVTLPLGKRT
jgi:hypothetical protein